MMMAEVFVHLTTVILKSPPYHITLYTRFVMVWILFSLRFWLLLLCRCLLPILLHVIDEWIEWKAIFVLFDVRASDARDKLVNRLDWMSCDREIRIHRGTHAIQSEGGMNLSHCSMHLKTLSEHIVYPIFVISKAFSIHANTDLHTDTKHLARTLFTFSSVCFNAALFFFN